MANKKHILTKKTAKKAAKKKQALSQTPAAIAKRRERERKAGLIPVTRQRGRKPGSRNKPKPAIPSEVPVSILAIMPPREKIRRMGEIMTNLEKEELHILHIYPKLESPEKLKQLDRLKAIVKEQGVMALYNEMLLSEQTKKKNDA